MINVNFLVFDDFESLDLFGVVEIFGRLQNNYVLNYYSMEGGLVKSSQNVEMMTQPITRLMNDGILIVPGGAGTRTLVNDEEWIEKLKRVSLVAANVLTICTGSALLAKTGLLNNKKATSNKRAFEWVKSVNESVLWQEKARWVVADKYYTSSGVSAGMDMALGFIADQRGKNIAEKISFEIEYSWNDNPNNDLFA
ncbi:DJ-1/PfpI family protein [Tetragenococcus koreensis]|uniref:DJ-1/PfpI domain-containing protein n=1 Tax=Tetragenococcus koreensis TaxID=290335 RepID=A0AAN4RLH0_9ENTE|nr:DJ-1/PfpI family protein [Tetragenococcus koreensis]MCF1586220.1 DJ-1/PfpI family protein [Tetragenococcus koreensis]MCF1615793.1 DJ-1/PfpI family protein [Tetragenococcus koreensis]MCF1620720.1 DJ-1/PfpI family protein [Tetragenococcus koreensis]MCF1625593.1 DJ-1/PfpI family protein [Tetragenococcus koreensis]MCF1626311.1 DJ-1/PfpI family protein [Tetragenococcus koreensis]